MLVYTSKDEGGNPWHYERVSSLKTEFIVKNHADLIGSDVVSWAYINMIMWREYEGGIELYNINKVDMGGWIPDIA